MVKVIAIILISFIGLYAKSSVGACIPIGKVVVLKKSIMSLELSKDQKSKLLSYEERLKDGLSSVKDNSHSKDERLSSLFDDKQFLKKKFSDITEKENKIITKLISEYFEDMYKTLTPEQRVHLIKRFKRIEKKRNKKK